MSFHNSIKITPFEALYGYKPRLLPAIGGQTTVATVGTYLQQRQDTIRLVKAELGKAQNRIKQLADKKRSEKEFLVGEGVYLTLSQQDFKALTHKPISKLSPKHYGPFTILEKIWVVPYKLQLPEGSQIHPTFLSSREPLEHNDPPLCFHL